MTRILDRYVGRQVLMAAVFSVVIFMIILILGNLFKDILNKLASRPDVNVFFVLKYVGLIVPFSLSYALPFSFLTAILLAFGKLSADSELTSMRMAGLSLIRICLPVVLIAVIFTGICGWINLSVGPWAKSQLEGLKDSVANQIRRNPMFIMKDKEVINEFNGYLIYADVQDDILKNFLLIQNEGPQAQLIASSDVAKLRVDDETNELIVDLYDSNLLTLNGNNGPQPGFFAEGETSMSLDKLAPTNPKLKPQNVPFFSLVHLVTKGPKDSPIFLNDNVLTDDRIALLPAMKARLKTELSIRFAYSVACLAFAFIAVPLGITAQRRESTVGFVIALPVFVIYYVLLNVTSAMADKPESNPHLLVWIPNILCITLGLILFIRVSRK